MLAGKSINLKSLQIKINKIEKRCDEKEKPKLSQIKSSLIYIKIVIFNILCNLKMALLNDDQI